MPSIIKTIPIIWKNYGYLAAVDPQYAVSMQCDTCLVKWTGCWDAYECPECGNGELPSCNTILDEEIK